MTKEELINYCTKLGLVKCKLLNIEVGNDITVAFRLPSAFTHKFDYIAAYDNKSNQVLLASRCSIYDTDPPIRMIGTNPTSNLSDEAIMDRIDELTKEVAENVLFIKYRNMKTRISKLNGDFN